LLAGSGRVDCCHCDISCSRSTKNLTKATTENRTLRRSLDGARANVKRERERNVTQIFGQ
jgi:hypothetical protein